MMTQDQSFIVDMSQVVRYRHQTEALADLQVRPGCFARPAFLAVYTTTTYIG